MTDRYFFDSDLSNINQNLNNLFINQNIALHEKTKLTMSL